VIVISHAGRAVSANAFELRTKITVGGNPAKRSALTQGVTCTFHYPSPSAEAEQIICK
jgi:hypothetical protein